MPANLSTIAYAGKSLWPQERVRNLVYQNQPFLAMVPKDTNFRGKNAVIGVRYGDTMGRSATFSTAQANKGNHSGVAFTVTRAKDYALFSVDGETLEALKGDKNALVEALDGEQSSAFHAIKRSLGQALYRSGTGSIGQRGSNSSSTTTLKNKRDIVNFEVGMKLTAHATDGGAALDSGNVLTITHVDRAAGTFTYTGSISGYNDDDFLVPQGDLNARLKGLAAWLPATAPDSTAFFGVDRSADTDRLGGMRINISDYTHDEGMLHAANRVGLAGGQPTHCFVHYDHYTALQNSLGSKVVYDDLSVGQIGFRAIVVGPGIKVLPDLNCPSEYGYMLQMDTWKLRTLGECPRFMNADGMDIRAEYNADAYEGRVGYYGNLTCDAPGWNAVLTMPTLPAY